MHKILPAFITGTALLMSSCNNTPTNGANTVEMETSIVSVESKSPVTDYKPAFAGQTRVGSVKTTTALDTKVISNDLNKPWGIVSLPDGRLLITEKGGEMKIVTSAGVVGNPIGGLPKVNPSGQGGLLGLALDPAFSSNRMIYWAFSENTPKGNLTAIAKGRLSADEKQMENTAVIYRATPAYDGDLHYGSRIVFDKSGNLIISTGERSDKVTRPQAQALNSALGKTIRITTNGQAASDNPFLNQAGVKPEIYTYGHRNVQGLAIHPETGDLWENEFGPKGGDEVNLIQPGKNYGWPIITYGVEYAGGKIGEGITQKAGMEQPVYYWDPVVSPSGMTFYSSDVISEWKNNLFISSLSAEHIIRLVIENNKVVGEERLLEKENQRFRDVTQGIDGALYAVTDQGRLYRIGKK